MKIFKEFKEFISRGNVLDMAVGVIMATAFGKITTALVEKVVMPFIGWIFGGVDLSKLDITLKAAELDATGEVATEAVVLGIGAFITTIIDFLIVALVVFAIVKSFNKARALSEARKKKEEAPAEEAPAAPTEAELLTEIRDLLKEQNK